MVQIIINNKVVVTTRNSSVLQACNQVGIEVPKFCYHDKLIIAGNCRICLVEIKKFPKPVSSCTMPVSDHIEIYTDTPLVKKSRELILEFLLVNHPLDCPICDQGGECDLQNQNIAYGSDFSRFFFSKRSVFNGFFGPLVKTVINRCIHCTRCVRFLKNYAGYPSLGMYGRGGFSEIGFFSTSKKKLVISYLFGNIIDLCPVGYITIKNYADNSN